MKKSTGKDTSTITRRKFVQVAGVASAGAIVMPAHMHGMLRHSPANKLNIAFVGVGGKGEVHVSALKHENYVAFCDVDEL